MPGSLPGGKLAPTASILIPGVRFLSPGSQTLVKVQQGSWEASVRPLSITDSEIDAVLPADTPPGEVGIAIANAQGTSRAEMMVVARSAPGIYTLNREGWGPVADHSFRARDRVTLRVNGLRERRPRVFLAGRPVSGVSTNRSTVSFLIPKDTTAACWSPVWIESETGSLSNFVTISISGAKGRDCQETGGWPLHRFRTGARAGLVLLSRVEGSIEMQPGRPLPFLFDGAEADFFQAKDAPPAALQALPPEGTCTAYTGAFTFDPGALFSVNRSFGEFGAPLDAGTLTIRGGKGTRSLSGGSGVYAAMFGGRLPVLPGPEKPIFVEPGRYQIYAEGSPQIGGLSVGIDVPPPFEWRNSDLTEVDRSHGVELSWSDIGADRQMVLAALSVNSDTSAMGGSLCLAPLAARSMRIPPYALANFPETVPGGLPERLIVLISIPRKSKVELDRLDDFRALFLEIHAKTVSYK